MVTRLKNIKYKPFTKALNLILLILCLILTVSATFYTWFNIEYVQKTTFYETNNYYYLFRDNLNDAITYHFDETLKDEYIDNHMAERSYLINERNRIAARLESNKNFLYYFRTKDGEVYTNLKEDVPPDYLMSNREFIYVNGDVVDPISKFGSRNMFSVINKSKNYNIEIWAATQRSIYKDDEFSKGEHDFSAFKHDYYGILSTAISSALISIILFTVLIVTAGKSAHYEEPKTIFFDRIFNEIQYILLGGYIVLVSLSLASIASSMEISDTDFEKIFMLISVYGTLLYIGCMAVFLSFVRLIKSKKYIENFLVYRAISGTVRLVMGIIRGTLFNPFVIGGMAGLGLINILAGVLSYNNLSGGGILFLLMVMAIDGFAIKRTYEFLKSLKTLTTASGLVVEGTMDYDFSDERISKSLLPLAENILQIKEGIKNAVDKELKIEKMKANLITNVSHDLKTPLTSIITYTKLLKDKDLSDDEATQYIEIIDSKSEKLKRLIEDIVEVNKASTGNIIVELGQLNLSEVVNQISGEYEDGLSEKNLKLVTSSEKKNVEVTADGKLVFRVFENLLDNILKYALGGTRVFVDVDVEGEYGVVTIKNITNHSLESISEDDLADRFVRADESRSSEGFGLGLSIADSLIKSMNGEFEITIDGDLFKTRVKLPLKK